MRKSIALLIAIMMLVTLVAGCVKSETGDPTGSATEPAGSVDPSGSTKPPEPTKPYKAALITAMGGLGDGSYNDSIYSGFIRAQEELGVDIQVVEPSEIAEVQGHFIQLAKSGEYDLICGVGLEAEEYGRLAAEEFPDQLFVFIDSSIDDLPNVTSVKIAAPEMCFMCGVIAGLYTESNVIGIVGGMEGPAMDDRCTAPFAAGAKLVNPDAEIKVKFSGSWSDSSAGKGVALTLHQEGSDVIFPYAGGSGLGVFSAALEKDFYVVGAGENQNSLAPDLTIASGLFFYGNLAYYCIEHGIAGTLEAGLLQAGLAQQGVGYTTEDSNVPMSADTVAKISEIEAMVVAGKIVIPPTLADLDATVAANAAAYK